MNHLHQNEDVELLLAFPRCHVVLIDALREYIRCNEIIRCDCSIVR
jgi:hypothetical protein